MARANAVGYCGPAQRWRKWTCGCIMRTRLNNLRSLVFNMSDVVSNKSGFFMRLFKISSSKASRCKCFQGLSHREKRRSGSVQPSIFWPRVLLPTTQRIPRSSSGVHDQYLKSTFRDCECWQPVTSFRRPAGRVIFQNRSLRHNSGGFTWV